MKFEEKAESMNLINNGNRTFSYQDNHGAVTYKYLYTADNHEIPYLALYAGASLDDLTFKTILSDLYEFEGNEIINDSIRSNINSGNNSILREEPFISSDYCTMYNQIIIDNSRTIQQGTIYPTFVIVNSYNGTRKKEISFGINIEGEFNIHGCFRNKLGTISQIHNERYSTSIQNVFSDYIEIISSNIVDVINNNMNQELNNEAVLTTLEYIEHYGGKKRREHISVFLSDLTNGDERTVTNWDLFLSILRYSETEKNINIKILMENLAERTLEFPSQMINACNRVNS
jgi:hypothetical protein